MNADAYATIIRQLMPPGRLWKVGSDGVIHDFALGAADELQRVDERGQALSWESDPRTATELLPDFERVLGLSSDGTLEERRARVVARLVARNRFRPSDFQEALAPLLGQAAEDVVVIETSAAVAAAMGHPEEIYRFFIYRDPDEPGTPDLAAAQELVTAMKPSHTQGHVIESINFLCDDEDSLCDRDLLGA